MIIFPLQLFPKPPATPLTVHQTRVQKSLEKINIPVWFNPSNKPVKQKQSYQSDKPGWKRDKETESLSTQTADLEPTRRQWLNSRETSTCPSFSSCHSQWSTTRRAYSSMRDGSLQSWQPPISQGYQKPYLGWRSHHQHKDHITYLSPPAQRLASSAVRESQSTVLTFSVKAEMDQVRNSSEKMNQPAKRGAEVKSI